MRVHDASDASFASNLLSACQRRRSSCMACTLAAETARYASVFVIKDNEAGGRLRKGDPSGVSACR